MLCNGIVSAIRIWSLIILLLDFIYIYKKKNIGLLCLKYNYKILQNVMLCNGIVLPAIRIWNLIILLLDLLLSKI